MKPNAILIHPDDNVAIALADIARGETVFVDEKKQFQAISDIAYSHKALMTDIVSGQDIIKYGEVIGQANAALNQGEWIHTHNMQTDEE